MCANPRAPPPERTTPSARPTSRRASRPAPGSLGSVVASRWWARGCDGIEQRAERLARRRPEDHEVGSRGEATGGCGLSAVATSSIRSACRAQRSLHTPAPASSTRSTCAFSSSARSTAFVPAASASSTSTGPYAASAPSEGRRDRCQRNTRIESPEREERRPGRRRVQAAARLELGGELPRDRGREPGVALHQLDEAPAAELEQRRVADRLDRRRARRAGQERELPDRGARARGRAASSRPPSASATARSRPRRTTNRSSASSPSRITQSPASTRRGLRVGRKRLERLRVGAGEERHAGQRRDGDARRAQRSPRSMRRSYAARGAVWIRRPAFAAVDAPMPRFRRLSAVESS